MLSSGQLPGAAVPQAPSVPDSGERFALTVDSIMRGPRLVGYPPSQLRWAGDSSRLYFEWRRPEDVEASTWVVNKDGSGLRRLSESERRSVPAAASIWDETRRRALFVDDGDIVTWRHRAG